MHNKATYDFEEVIPTNRNFAYWVSANFLYPTAGLRSASPLFSLPVRLRLLRSMRKDVINAGYESLFAVAHTT